MNTADTSVLVAAFADWHEHHDPARHALVDCRLIAHTALELLSVLTRLPEPHRVDATLVAELIERNFPGAPLVLLSHTGTHVVRTLADAGVVGGAVYDGLIALTALEHGATLLSLDQRAARTYERLGVDFRLLPA